MLSLVNILLGVLYHAVQDGSTSDESEEVNLSERRDDSRRSGAWRIGIKSFVRRGQSPIGIMGDDDTYDQGL